MENIMNLIEINEYIIEEMGFAEKNNENVTIRLNLSDGECLELWFDEETECYSWTAASFEYEDVYSVTHDIMGWLEDRSFNVIGMETI